MKKIQPLKRFGQNYLRDRNILQKIVTEINPRADDLIIEIGPGLGMLTRELAGKAGKLIGVEIDKRVAEDLRSEHPEMELINDDFLKVNLLDIYSPYRKKIRVVGNIPYNITSPIIFKLIKDHILISDAVFMIQHEVAKRITAEKRTKDYGILTVILQYFAEVKYCFKVSPGAFYPMPKVDSAVIHIFFKDIDVNYEYEVLFIKVVKSCFGNRRKTLRNSLNNSIFGGLDLTDSRVDLSKRAEELDLADFLKLTDHVYGKLNV